MSAAPGYPDESQTVDTLLDTLCHPVRREVIYYFERVAEDEHTDLSALVQQLEARLSSETDEQIRLKLAHSHLPKLAQRGWLEHDADTGDIRYHGHDSAKRLLRDVHDIF